MESSHNPLLQTAAHLSELRIESPPSNIGFSDPCPCCDSKKRHCLLPSAASPSFHRKKLLVFDFSDHRPSLPESPSSDFFNSTVTIDASSPNLTSLLAKSMQLPKQQKDVVTINGTCYHDDVANNGSTLDQNDDTRKQKGKTEIKVGVKCKCGARREITLIQ